MDTVLSIFFFTIQCGRGTHVHPSVSSVAENIACSQKSTCLTCWPWCYSVRPCHRMTSVTHRSLSSLPPQPTLLMLTHWHKFFLTVLVCRPSVCSPLSVLSFPYFLFFLLPSLPEGLCFFFFSFLFFFLFFYHFAFFSHISLSLSLALSVSLSLPVSHSSVSFPRPTPVGLGGQQAMTVVLAVDCEVTFAQPHWDSAALSEPQKQRERNTRG